MSLSSAYFLSPDPQATTPMSEQPAEFYERPSYSVGLHEWLPDVLKLSDAEVATAHGSIDEELPGDTMDYMVKFAELGWTTERIYVHLRSVMGNEFLSDAVWIHLKMCAAVEHVVRLQGLTERTESVHEEEPIGLMRNWVVGYFEK